MKLAEKKVDGQIITEDDIEKAMKEVFGKDHPGRVRGMGPIVTQSKYYGGRFLNLSTSNEPGSSSSSTQEGLMKFVLSYLAEKHPEDDLISQLPPFLRRHSVGENQRTHLPHSNSRSMSRESPRSSSEE